MVDHAKDPAKNNHGIPHENAAGDVHQPAPGARKSSLARIEMLVAHHRHPAPELVSEIMVEYPGEHDAIVAWLHAHFGNAYVHEVLTAGTKTAKKAHGHDVSFEQRGSGASGHENAKADYGIDPAHPDKKPDPNRMTDHGTNPTLVHACSVYRGDGTGYNAAQTIGDQAKEQGQPAPATLPPADAIVQAQAGSTLRVQTGAVKAMVVAGPDGTPSKQPCVLCFQVGDQRVTGWVPVWAIDPAHVAFLGVDTRIAHDLERAGAKEKFATTPRTVTPRPSAHPHLRVQPNQNPNGANMAEHYCERPGGVVNLLSNVPGGTEGRFGVAIDVLPAGVKFYASTSVASEHTPLWESGSNSPQTKEKLTFVYGKIDGPDGPRYGWINHDMLS